MKLNSNTKLPEFFIPGNIDDKSMNEHLANAQSRRLEYNNGNKMIFRKKLRTLKKRWKAKKNYQNKQTKQMQVVVFFTLG